MLEQQLAVLGFTSDEVKIYVQVLDAGSITVGALAKKTSVPRPTLYYQLEKLQERGLIGQTLKRGVKTFFAESPQKIALLFEQHQQQVKLQQQAFSNLLPQLEAKVAGRFLQPRFKLYEGREGLEQIMQDMLLYPETENLCFWPAKEMIEILSPEFMEKHHAGRVKNNSPIRVIWPEASIVDPNEFEFIRTTPDHLRTARVAPAGVTYTMGYWIYGRKIAFLSSLKECFGFTIESDELVQMQTAQFEILWQLCRPYQPPA